MSGDFSYKVRKWNNFNPNSKDPFRLSRSKVDLFMLCPRCFYLDQRLGVSRPKSFPFNLNNAVDTLLKKEFDIHRLAESVHPLVKEYGLDAVPFKHELMDTWRDALKNGISFHHEDSNLLLRGGVDDVWINKKGEIIIVDYKATSKETEVTLDADWQDGYKRQMEIYQWLFDQNGFKVSPTGYFVYVNGKTDRASFDARLDFDAKLIPYEGDRSWIPAVLVKIRKCLEDARIPAATEDCEYCGYVKAVKTAEIERYKANQDSAPSEMVSKSRIAKKKTTIKKTKTIGHKMPTLF